MDEKHATYRRNWRKSHPLYGEQREKQSARAYAHSYLTRGLLKKKDCAVCGSEAQMHHPDYDRPLDVVWLCKKHHRDAHDWPIFLLAARKPDHRADHKERVNPDRA
jgi:hypothetical protein